MHPADLPSHEEEKCRYEEHNNDVFDPRYRDFVKPLSDAVLQEFPSTAKGLDYGAGTGPVVAQVLSEKGYDIRLYDMYFHPDTDALKTSYDYIVASEVVEHFKSPFQEFKRLKSLLKPGGVLYCKTSLLDFAPAFDAWKYKDDQTHLVFYHSQSLEWIKTTLGFSSLTYNTNLIRFVI